MLDGGTRRCPCTAIVAGYENDIGFCFGDTSGNCSDSDLGNQLDIDARVVVGVLLNRELIQQGLQLNKYRGEVAVKSGLTPGVVPRVFAI